MTKMIDRYLKTESGEQSIKQAEKNVSDVFATITNTALSEIKIETVSVQRYLGI